MKKIIFSFILMFTFLTIQAGNNLEISIIDTTIAENVTSNFSNSNIDLFLYDSILGEASCLKKAMDLANHIEEISDQEWTSEEWGDVFRNLFDVCNMQG